MNEIDAFEFVLAEALSMTVAQLNQTMTNQEYLMWRAWYAYKASKQQMHEVVDE